MFNFFSILLLLTAVLQIAEAIKIWVKPSDQRYDAEIICLNSNGLPITIGWAKLASVLGEAWSTRYVNIDTDLSRCEDVNPNVKIRITNLDRPYTSKKFEIPKAELSARRTAVVLAFNIVPSAHKQFYFQQSSSSFGGSQRPLLDYELEIKCHYKHADGKTKFYLIGSGVQKHRQNGIIIPIYEIEKLALCQEGKIDLIIYNAERKKTSIDVTRAFLLDNNAFNIDIVNETVQPILQRRIEMVEEIEPKMKTMYL